MVEVGYQVTQIRVVAVVAVLVRYEIMPGLVRVATAATALCQPYQEFP